jgi:hypothetical protein
MGDLIRESQLAQALLGNQDFISELSRSLGGLSKADTISQATGLLWYDLRPVVQLLYPFRELIPLISRLPRVPYDGGSMFHWMRVIGIDAVGNQMGVSEGNRGSRISVTRQDQSATYKTMGRESSVTFQARWGSKNLEPEALALATQSTLRSVMIGEEIALLNGNASLALGVTPTPTGGAVASSSGSSFTTGNVYVIAVALTGMGFQGYTTWNNTSLTGGIPGQIIKTNADGSQDTFGGGSGQPSAEATFPVTAGQTVKATVTPVPGAVAYGWFVGQTSGAERLAAITQSNQAIFTKSASGTAQPATSLQVTGAYADNSTNALLPDGLITQVFGSSFGAAASPIMTTNPSLPSGVTLAASGALVYTAASGNTGLTIAGTNINEFDVLLQAAYDQYKVGFSRILMSSVDIESFTGTMFAQSANNSFRILFDAERTTGRIVAGHRITSYINKFFGNTLDIDIHPFVPPGTIIFWSDRVPYELSGVTNLFEAHVRQDYYQVQWPFRTMRYEYGVYVDEVFANYFLPAFAIINNLNPPAGTTSY